MSNQDKKFIPGPVETSIVFLVAKSVLAGLVQALAFCLVRKNLEKDQK